MLIGERLTPEKQESWLRKFGMGQTSGMGYPAESRGILPAYKDWSGSQRYTIMFGSGISLTAIQATGVYQTIANKGVRIPARVIGCRWSDHADAGGRARSSGVGEDVG